MKLKSTVLIMMCLTIGLSSISLAKTNDIQQQTAAALQQLLDKLNSPQDKENLVCLTNAGFAKHEGVGTQILWQTIRETCGISIETGNILPMHTDLESPLFFALAHKTGPESMPMGLASFKDGVFEISEPVDAWVKKHQSFEAYNKVLGPRAFALVGLANGWANKIPEDMMRGALYHDHLCCGVYTGQFTVDFIKQNFPLEKGQRYTYVGLPAWCQDDYIITAMNLTPGKSGYHSMQFHWSQAWKTKDKEYRGLGGMIIRYNPKEKKGDAHLLGFDWREEDFRAYINEPDLKIEWHGMQWLHIWYDKFFMANAGHPEKFVSVIAAKSITSQEDLESLIGVGANPLEVMLGKRVK